MKDTGIMKKVNRIGFKLKKYSPEIFVAAGIVGVVSSAVLACKATTRVQDILEKTKTNVDIIHDRVNNENIEQEYTEEDAKKELTIVYAQTGVEFIKLYAPAVILGTLSIASIINSHRVLQKRNIALGAAYATVDKGFKEYRNRVAERFGEDVEKEIKYNIKAKKFEETVTDENGKEKKVKKTVNVVDPNLYSDYARFFDDGCKGWEKDPEYNLMFLKAQQQYANDLLVSRGHLFLNEVYDMLGIPRSKAGQVVGWIYDPENPVGDNFVDFGIYEADREKARDFVNGYERSILLDFNVDGNIWEKM